MHAINLDLVISVTIQLIAIGVFIGVYKTTISFMQLQIEELKTDMRKYNNILERMIVTEQSLKTAHHRIDSVEYNLSKKYNV